MGSLEAQLVAHRRNSGVTAQPVPRCFEDAIANGSQILDESETSEVNSKRTWTQRYRMPLAVLTGLLAALCFVALFSGSTALIGIGIGGLVILVVWVVVFQLLYRRGY